MQEYNAPQSFDKPARQPEGDILVDGANIGIDVGELSRREKIASALADIDDATQTTTPAPSAQPLVEAVQKRLEYAPLAPHQVVKLIGRKVVFDLRKGYNETHINIFDDSTPSTPYIYSPDPAQVPTKEELTKRAEGLSRDDLDLAA